MVRYQCVSCGALLKPKPGDCCVFCSYADIHCPNQSIWQTFDFDVVSICSQNITERTLQRLLQLRKGYKDVFLWLDGEQASMSLLDHVGDTIEVVRAEEDANELLQRGELEKFRFG
jgi:hypothetical protein